MATHGSIGEFIVSIKDWPSYKERLEPYFTANSMDSNQPQAEQRQAILQAVCGPTTYPLIQNLPSPAKPFERKYTNLCRSINSQLHQLLYNSSTSTTECNDKESQWVTLWLSSSRNTVHFGDQLERWHGDQLEDVLRDGLVCVWLLRQAASTDSFDSTKFHIWLSLQNGLCNGEWQCRKSRIYIKMPPTLFMQFSKGHSSYKTYSNKPKKEQSACYCCGGEH